MQRQCRCSIFSLPESFSLHETGRVTRREWRLIGYASGNFGKNLVWSTADITLLFILTDLVGMPVASAALLMTIAVGGDLIFDLLAGAISAQVKAYGAGYRWLITHAAIPCGIAFMLLYALPWWGEHRFWTIAAVVLVFRVAFAVVDVPHFAMMASMASDSRARGRTAGYRSFFSNISSLNHCNVCSPACRKIHQLR